MLKKGAHGRIQTSEFSIQASGLNHIAIQATSVLVVKLGIYSQNKLPRSKIAI